MPCDPNALLEQAGALSGYSEKDLLVVQTQLLCNISSGFDPSNFVPKNDPAETFTEGSVLFIGPAGGATQDNANFYWDNTAKSLRLFAHDSAQTPDSNTLKGLGVF